MKYYEAMSTGRPFKRKDWHGYVTGLIQGEHIDNTSAGCIIYWVDDSPHGIRHAVNVEELLADDWEVKEKEVMITKSQLLEAATQSLKDKWGADGCLMTHDEYAHMALTLIIDGLVKKLGLE
jgi:hypothetical protein